VNDDAHPDGGDHRQQSLPTDPVPGGTGHRVVDEVLGSLDGLGQQPLATQVEVLERAHERLRAALAEAPEADGTDSRDA
jgi:hypothetical protein